MSSLLVPGHIFKTLKNSSGCSYEGCGQKDPRVLEFDHLGDKKKNVSQCSSIAEVDIEIAKCRILCCYHHRLVSAEQHAERRVDEIEDEVQRGNKERRLRNQEYVVERKKSIGKCQRCEFQIDASDWRSFSGFYFSYITVKTGVRHSVSEMVMRQCSIETIKNAMSECELLCGNCAVMKKNSGEVSTDPTLREVINAIQKHELVKFVEESQSFTELAKKCGLMPNDGRVRFYLLESMEKFDITCYHFRCKNRLELFSDDMISRIVRESRSWKDFCVRMGYKSTVRVTQERLRSALTKRNIPFDNLDSQESILKRQKVD